MSEGGGEEVEKSTKTIASPFKTHLAKQLLLAVAAWVPPREQISELVVREGVEVVDVERDVLVVVFEVRGGHGRGGDVAAALMPATA